LKPGGKEIKGKRGNPERAGGGLLPKASLGRGALRSIPGGDEPTPDDPQANPIRVFSLVCAPQVIDLASVLQEDDLALLYQSWG
jgi:hypothetical protein